jgi:hypothetical protein
MDAFRERFVERQNIAHYTNQLMTETDPIKRETLHKLLAEEIIKTGERYGQVVSPRLNV